MFQKWEKLWEEKVNLAGARVGGRPGPILAVPWQSQQTVRVRPRVREASRVPDGTGKRGVEARGSDFSAVKWSGRTGEGEGRDWRSFRGIFV